MPKSSTTSPSSKVTVNLRGRDYVVACDQGEERRLAEIVKTVEAKLAQVDDKSGNPTETRLFMLTCLMLADELMEAKKAKSLAVLADEDLMVTAVDHLRQRVATIAQAVGRA